MAVNRTERRGICRAIILFILFLIPQTLFADPEAPNNPIENEKLFSIEVRDAEISDVLRALAQQSGLNIILGEGVAGKISLSFRNIPFMDAMEMIIKANGLMYTTRNNILWVGRKVDVSEELRIEILRLNNADPVNAVL